jgi:hypothetical protein
LDWKRKTVSFDMGGGRETVEWKKRGQQNWRHPITLMADRDYDVPPGYQVVIGVERIKDEEFKGYSTREGIVTPLRTKERLDQRFMVGYGYGGVEGRVLVFNPAETGLRIKKGCRVAELHPGGKFSSGRGGESAGTGVDNGANGINKRERASGVETKEEEC